MTPFNYLEDIYKPLVNSVADQQHIFFFYRFKTLHVLQVQVRLV